MYELDYNNTIPSYEKLLTNENSMEYGIYKELIDIAQDIENLSVKVVKICTDWRMQVCNCEATWDSTIKTIEEMEETIKDVFYNIIERLD